MSQIRHHPILFILLIFKFIFFFFFFFGEKENWRNLLQKLYRTLLGRVQAYLLKPKSSSLEPIHRPRNRLSSLNLAGSWFQLKVAYDSSVIRSAGTPIRGHTPIRQADQPRQPGEEQEDSSLGRRGQPSPPKTQDHGCGPRCDFYWPPLLPRSARPSSYLICITRMTNDSISIHVCSDWSMRETIVSGVSCAPTARQTASLSQTKSVCSAFSTRDPQQRHDSLSLFLKRFRNALKQPWEYYSHLA